MAKKEMKFPIWQILFVFHFPCLLDVLFLNSAHFREVQLLIM